VDTTLKGLLGLLDEADVEARCAALLVLTRLRPTQPLVIRSVTRALESSNVVVRDFALGYFEAARPKDGLAALLPLLDVEDDAVRRRAVDILAAYGHAAVAAARKLANDGPRRRSNAIIDLCARVCSAGALDFLFGLMAGDDFETNRAACDAVIASLPGAARRAREDLFRRATALAEAARGHRTARVAAAKLLGGLGDPRARKTLFAMLDSRQPPVVRSHALGALQQCLRGQKLSPAEIERLLPLLDEEDEANLVRPAVRLLEDQSIDRTHMGVLGRLAESPQPLVKRLAVQKLGAFESAWVVRTLIGYLTDDSYARRDQATASLKNLPAARAELMKEFLACEDERKAWTLSDILLLHDRAWKKPTLTALWQKLEKAREKRDDRLYAAYLHFLSELDADWTAAQVRSRAAQLRRGKRFSDSARWLGLLKDSPAWDPETRYAFALATLKSHKHGLTAPVRRRDLALDELRALAETPFPLAERLRRERVPTPEDLYYVAFNLAEQRGEARAVARELLEHVVEKHGRSKVGKAARNKLKLVS
jgi:HEAT repeat protein